MYNKRFFQITAGIIFFFALVILILGLFQTPYVFAYLDAVAEQVKLYQDSGMAAEEVSKAYSQNFIPNLLNFLMPTIGFFLTFLSAGLISLGFGLSIPQSGSALVKAKKAEAMEDDFEDDDFGDDDFGDDDNLDSFDEFDEFDGDFETDEDDDDESKNANPYSIPVIAATEAKIPAKEEAPAKEKAPAKEAEASASEKTLNLDETEATVNLDAMEATVNLDEAETSAKPETDAKSAAKERNMASDSKNKSVKKKKK